MASDFKHDISVIGMGQPNESTCWLASYQMIYRYLRRPIEAIEDTLRTHSIDVADARDNGLEDTKYAKAANALGLEGWSGKRFSIEANGGLDAFLQELRLGPLWVSRISGRGYHAVVATGYINGQVIFNNPFPGPKDAFELPLAGNLFVRNISAAAYSVQAWRYRIGMDD